MKFKKQISSPALERPADYRRRNLSHLIDNGLIVDLTDGGFPLYTPIGSALLDNIESVFADHARQSGFDHMRIPNAMSTGVLEKGQEIGEQFRSKLMRLTGDLKDYHVMATPEMLFVQWARQYQISHKQLPMRLYYLDELHRQMHYTKGSLISRQIRIFGGFLLEERGDPDARHPGSDLVREFCERAMTGISMPYHVESDQEFDHEFFYVSPVDRGVQEGDNIVLPGINKDERTKAFSLGMVYDYPMNGEWALRYRDENNKNKKPALLTFGFCTHRVLYCMLIDKRDDLGFALPKPVRPFDVVVIPANDSAMEAAEKIYSELSGRFNANGRTASHDRVALDDRTQKSIELRSDFADYIGSGAKVVVGRDHFLLTDRSGQTLCKSDDINSFLTSVSHCDIP